jgi:hypothetical protein
MKNKMIILALAVGILFPLTFVLLVVSAGRVVEFLEKNQLPGELIIVTILVAILVLIMSIK